MVMGTATASVTAMATRFFILLSTPFPCLHHRSPSLLRLTRHRLASFSYLSSNVHTLPFTNPSPSKSSPSPRHLHNPAAASLKPDYFGDPSASTLSFPSQAPHPFPEWSRFVDNLSTAGYFNDQSTPVSGDEFVGAENMSLEFLREASAFLAFSRDRPNLLRLLSRKDVEVVVENCTPFLFKNADDSVRRMKSFLDNGETAVLDADRAQSVDLIKFIISFASNLSSSPDRGNHQNGELIIASVQKLLDELAKLSYVPPSNIYGSVEGQSPGRSRQSTRLARQNLEMKVGDWICPRCSFMNFARNVKCLECQEVRPKRQLTGGEWECPQCDFFNYGRNKSCLRCDCKRPGGGSFGASNNTTGLEYGAAHTNNLNVNSRLAANEEKAQRWISKISQQDSNSDMNSAIADEDFPEIMPLRKGVNRFVVSTRKTPLERRLADAQYRNDLQTGEMTKSSNAPIHRSIDEILGRSSGAQSDGNKKIAASNASTEQSSMSMPALSSSRYDPSEGTDSSYVPPEIRRSTAGPENEGCSEAGDGSHFTANSTNLPGTDNRGKEEAEKSDRWFKRVAELHDVSDLSNSLSDENFPEIMPMRKGENRFVVSRKKDRSLTSPAYKRRLAMEQASNNNYVPFVPFPPGYFAKKETEQPSGSNLTEKNNVGADSVPDVPDVDLQGSSEARLQVQYRDPGQGNENLPTSAGSGILITSREGLSNNTATQSTITSWTKNGENPSKLENFSMNNSNLDPNLTESSSRSSDIQNVRECWTGKSLEGSAVKDLDPLDMSEEAKAERWFRRVAQIKDISELSQIPDEDFPSIMPMRKGVNRFVVSKRKTPLERRLTSQQYRKSLPVINSDPIKRENEGS